jgi:hypothetical protein
VRIGRERIRGGVVEGNKPFFDLKKKLGTHRERRGLE